MRLAGTVAIVTGAGSGFGAGIARRFAAEGAAVVVNDVDTQSGETVERSIAESGGRASFRRADVADGPQVKTLVDHALQRFGRLDIVVNNAGAAHRRQSLLDVDEETFDRVFTVNVKSIYHSARHAVPVFRDQGGGQILNMASTAAERPRPGLTWYNASKGAVVTATKSMAVELAPDNIRVNALCPVMGETGLFSTFIGEDTPQARAAILATVPLGRFSTPEDIGSAAVFLVCEDSAFLTGVCLPVDGGRSV